MAPNQNSSPDGLRTNIVGSIPVHAPGGQPAPVDEEHELDKIMRDVGNELKKEDKKPAKKHWFSGRHKQKSDAKFSAQPVPAALPGQPPVPAPAPKPRADIALPAASPSRPQLPPKQPPPKPLKQSSTPVFAIFVALVVTGVLVAAAIAAYRQ